ncbi:glycosyltransferase family 4 protein [Limosilactobacillus vaginalis]|uniref:glycosyltransferase family 4 protein n=1 Tax=Limosilactobacillus vaginalis TaxID=1633 RepID=UPI0021B4DBA9|nr:glycosyltransferase family 4 protein [Limosilactobacillus vaginalis]UXC68523.1 glycosyltransferase family 4 protein [Limosilactobacillus vaginalis]
MLDQILIGVKRIVGRIKNIIRYPSDYKFLKFNSGRVKQDGIVLVIHESNRLGASLLLLHTAEELKRRGENIYIITFQFGELNREYSMIAPTQIVFSKANFRNTLKKLEHEYGYNKALMVTSAVGEYVKIAHELDYQIISEIHELPVVIRQLGLESAVRQMILYSDKIIFPTLSAKKEVLSYVNLFPKNKIYVKKQGIYFKKPNTQVLYDESSKLITKYPMLKNKNIIIGVGNTSRRKGIDIFIKTAKKLPQYFFIWAGRKENYYNTMQEYIKDTNNFLYLGELDTKELSAAYRLSSILLLTSRADTLPSTIFEASLFNLPVIGAISSGGVREVVKDKMTGFLTEEATPEQFTKAIEYIFSSNNYNRIKDNLLKNSGENSFSNYISFILNLYNTNGQ